MKRKRVFWLPVGLLLLAVVFIFVWINDDSYSIISKLENTKVNNAAWLSLENNEALKSMQILLQDDSVFEERVMALEQLDKLNEGFRKTYLSNKDQLNLVLEGKMNIDDLLVEVDQELLDRSNFLFMVCNICFLLGFFAAIFSFFYLFYIVRFKTWRWIPKTEEKKD